VKKKMRKAAEIICRNREPVLAGHGLALNLQRKNQKGPLEAIMRRRTCIENGNDTELGKHLPYGGYLLDAYFFMAIS
jgi:hypothetical protein